MKNLILLISIIFIYQQRKSNQSCLFEASFRDNQRVILTDFNNFTQLSFNCLKPINMSILQLLPTDRIILDDSLNFNQTKIYSTQSIFCITLVNIKGFNLRSNPFKTLNIINYVPKEFIYWSVSKTTFDFYDKNELIDNNCNISLLNPTAYFIFKDSIVTLEKDIIFSLKTCPLIFQNSKIRLLKIQISLSFINKNKLEFQQMNLTDNKLNSKIVQLVITLYHTDLDNKLLNTDVFKKLNFLDLNGVINSIQDDLFKSFNDLKGIRIQTQNIKKIFIINNNWLQYLNLNVVYDKTKDTHLQDYYDKIFFLILFQTFHRVTLYQYPDEDLCYFRKFPHRNLVMPFLKPTINSSCSCTKLFLMANSYRFKQFVDLYATSNIVIYYLTEYYNDVGYQKSFINCDNGDILDLISKCNFTKRLNSCNIEPIDKMTDNFYFYISDWSILVEKSASILYILNKAVSIVCFITNLLTIVVLLSNQPSKEFIKTYKYLMIHICFNLLYVLVSFFQLICYIDLIDEYRICYSQFIQYFKLISFRFLGSVFKTASNISHVSFTLSRYIAMTDAKLKLLQYFNMISTKRFLMITIIFSALVNLYICFEFVINEETSEYLQMGAFKFSNISRMYKDELVDEYKQELTVSDHFLFSFLQYIKIIFSDAFYIIV